MYVDMNLNNRYSTMHLEAEHKDIGHGPYRILKIEQRKEGHFASALRLFMTSEQMQALADELAEALTQELEDRVEVA